MTEVTEPQGHGWNDWGSPNPRVEVTGRGVSHSYDTGSSALGSLAQPFAQPLPACVALPQFLPRVWGRERVWPEEMLVCMSWTTWLPSGTMLDSLPITVCIYISK